MEQSRPAPATGWRRLGIEWGIPTGEDDRLRQFDVVLANPLYSILQWSKALWEANTFGRNRYGTPPLGRAVYAFFQHILASLRPVTGRCAILFPHGVLVGDEERRMHSKIVDDNLNIPLYVRVVARQLGSRKGATPREADAGHDGTGPDGATSMDETIREWQCNSQALR